MKNKRRRLCKINFTNMNITDPDNVGSPYHDIDYLTKKCFSQAVDKLGVDYSFGEGSGYGEAGTVYGDGYNYSLLDLEFEPEE